MSNAVSLQELMHDMARRHDLYEQEDRSEQASISEIDIYLRIDPLFADLHKQYMDAKQRRDDLVELYSLDEPMTEVATDVMDSADSARQTRLIELRQDKKIQVEAMYQAKILRKEHAHREQKRSNDYRQRLHEFYARGSQQSQKKQEAEGDFFLMIIIWMMLQDITRRAVRSLQLAHIFSNVSNDREAQAAA